MFSIKDPLAQGSWEPLRTSAGKNPPMGTYGDFMVTYKNQRRDKESGNQEDSC